MEDTRRKTLNSFCYDIHLRPTVILHNSLPVPLYIVPYGAVNELVVPAGASRYLSSVEPGAAFVAMRVINVRLDLKIRLFSSRPIRRSSSLQCDSVCQINDQRTHSLFV